MPTDPLVQESDTHAYTLEIREDGKRIAYERIVDPFITTSIRPTWRAAWAVLRGKYEVEVLVSGDRDRVEAVMELNPDYLGPAGSRSVKVRASHVTAYSDA